MSQSNYDKLTARGIRLKKRDGKDKVLCPECSHTRKNRKDLCLSVDIDEGVYNCHNPGCTFRGSVAEYRVPKKEYVRPAPWTNITVLPDKTVKWFAKRGISQRILVQEKIAVGTKFFYANGKTGRPQGEFPCMMFPYFRRGELINIKFRSADKSFMLEAGAELIFWGLDSIEGKKECMIVEGEPDRLSALEAGYENKERGVVSVPNGASKGRNNMEYLDNCIEYFDGMEKIIIAVDDDEAGRGLAAELIRRLGAERCYTIDFGYSSARPDVKWKDHNEVLAGKTLDDGTKIPGDGPLRLSEIYSFAKECPIKGIVTADDLIDGVLDLYNNGLPPGKSAGIRDKDGDLATFVPGQITIVTGVPSHGKSARVDDIICRLAVEEQWRFGIYSPENWPLQLHMSKLTEILIGKQFSVKGGYTNRLSFEDIIQARLFIRDHFFWINPEEEDISLVDLLDHGKSLVRRYGINGLLIDPWNTLEHQRSPGMMVDEHVSKSLGQIVGFNRRNMVHTFLIAHPTKLEIGRNGKYPVPQMYNISGGAHFYNKADNGICVYRHFDTNVTETRVQKVKHKHQGHVGLAEERYDYKTGRFYPLNSSPDTRNWLETGAKEVVAPPVQVYENEVVTADVNENTEPPF